MADLNKIIEDLSSLTVVEAAELSKQLEEKWGVSAAAAVAAAPAAGAGDAPAEEKPIAAKKAMLTSRVNTLLSIPMLLTMVAAQNLY